MSISWSFFYNFFVKLCGKKFGSHNMTVVIQIHVIMRCVIKGLLCIHLDTATFLLIYHTGSFLKKYGKTYVKQPLKKRQNKGLNDKW